MNILPPGEQFEGVFFGRDKIRGGGLELVLRNEGKFWYKVPCCCFLVDGCCYFLVAFCPSAHDSPSAVNIGGLEDLQRTQPMRGAHILTYRILKIKGNI